MKIIAGLKGVSHVVVQEDIYYDDILYKLKPDYVVHGDNWKKGYQKKVRERVIQVISEWVKSLNRHIIEMLHLIISEEQ